MPHVEQIELPFTLVELGGPQPERVRPLELLAVRRRREAALHVEHHRLMAHQLERLRELQLVVAPGRASRGGCRRDVKLRRLRTLEHQIYFGTDGRTP